MPPSDHPPIVKTALSKIGAPYRWGATGPNSFDCSGLIYYAYQQNGKTVPHSSTALRSVSQKISRADLKPGDLVFTGNPVHHVGWYIGEGRMVHSPRAGKRVEISSLLKPSSFGRLD